jgi:hypothetical protein
VSVVVVGSSTGDIGATLDALGRAGATDAELIVVAPDPMDVDGATVVCTQEGAGPLLGANHGAEFAAGELLVILTAGVRVRAGWLAALLAPFADPTVGVTGPTLLGPGGEVVAGGLAVGSDGTVSTPGRGRFGDDPSGDDPPGGVGPGSGPCPVDAVSGACLAVRAEVWHQLGGFDARYAPAGGEDLDLCFAARAAGWTVCYAPAAEVDAGPAQLVWAVGRERFVAKWRAVLEAQEPPGWPWPASPDRSRRAVGLPRPGGRGTLAAGRPIAVVAADPGRGPGPGGPAAGSERLVERARSVAGVLRAAGRTVDLVAEAQLADLGPGCDVWAVGLGAVERVAVAVRRTRADRVVVADLPSVRSAALRQRAERGEAWDLADGGEVGRAEAIERWVLGLADAVVTTSAAAAVRLRAVAPGAAVHVVPLASPVGPRRSLPGRGRPSLVVRVDAADEEDVIGARWLLKEVVPRVQLTFTDLGTTVVGDATRREIRQLAGPGVRLAGAVTFDAMSLPVTVAVGPWRAGSGMQPWTVEALAWGIPLVTTTAGAEGVPLVAGRDAVVVDDADAMARAVLELVTDHARWASLSESGQAVVRAHLQPGAVASGLSDLLPPLPARASR